MARIVLIFAFLTCSSYLEIVSSAKILALYPLYAYSHFRAFQPLLEELIRRGHSLTLLSNVPLSAEFQRNYTHMSTEKCVYRPVKISDMETLKMNPVQATITFTISNMDRSENIIKCPEVQEMIHSKNNYDLIISELLFSRDIFFAFGKKFNAPVISTTSQCLLYHHSWILGNPDPFHFPNSLTKSTENMSFLSRAVNFGYQLFSMLFYEFYSLPRYQDMMEKYMNFEKGNVPSMKEIMKNISVSLVNSHYSLGYIKPDLPNVVNVAGIHFSRSKPLPGKLMDEAEHGVIYVSFGSLIDTGFIHQLGLTLIDILKLLPQRVIIKWDQKLTSQGSKNILIGQWFPQSDILNHPNCRLFITHGGYLSLLESLNATVPVVGIPFFADQHYNLGMVESFELGMKVELDNVPSELSEKISEVLKNPKYKENMVKRSQLFRERLANPLDEAMYWVEHVLKHRTTTHLKSAAVQLTWYEFYAADILVLLLAIILLTLLAIKLLIAWVLRNLHARIKNIFIGGSQMPERKDYKCD